MAVEDAGVVDGDGLFLSGGGVDALLDESFGHGGDVGDAAVEPDRGVDAVGEEVAGHPGSGSSGIEAPEAFTTLREIGADGPVLQEVGAVVEDLAELAGVDDFLGEGDGRDATIVVPDRVGDAGIFDRIHHWRTLLGGAGQRFLAEDHLAGLGGGDRDGSVGVVGRADVDGVDVVAGNEGFPVSFDRLEAPLAGEGLGTFLIAGADGLEDRAVCEVGEEVVDALVSVGVGAAHEAVTDEANVEWFCHGMGSEK